MQRTADSHPAYVLVVAALALMLGSVVAWSLPGAEAEDPFSEEPLSKERAQKAKKKSASDEKTAPADEKKKEKKPVEVPRITGSGYVKAMEGVDPQKTTQKGVTLEVQVIPDGYSYLLAKQIEEFEKTGYEDEEMKKKLKSYHSQISDYGGKVLFLVSVTTGADTACFFTKDVPDLVVLSQKKATKTLSIRDVDPKLEIKKWKMFEHPAFGGTKRSTPGLARVRDLTFKAVSSTLKITDKEPVTFAIKKLLAQTKGDDPQNSVNFEERQLSVRSMDDIVIPSLEVTFRPTRWDIPKPPDGFAELVEWLRSK